MVLEKDGKPFKKYICQSTAYEQFGDPEKKALPTIYRIHSLCLHSWIFQVFRKVLKGEYDEKCVELKGGGFEDVKQAEFGWEFGCFQK